MTAPRLARALLERAVPPDEAGRSVIADFDEEFAHRAAGGAARARLWYWRQAIAMWFWSAMRHPAQSHHYPVGGALFDAVGDLRHAGRVALASPGQSLLIVATLALAIGTTTIGFAFADTVFLRGLPIADPQDTVIIYGVDARDPQRRTGVFYDDFLDFRERTRTLESLSTWTQTRVTMHRRERDTSRITVSRVTGDLFSVWGFVTPAGRGLRAADSERGASRVAVLSDRYWREAFGSSPQALGESVVIDGVAHEIVGVLGADVEFGTFANIAMWVSFPPPAREPAAPRDVRPTMIAARLAGGATVDAAAAEFQALAARLEQEYPQSNRGRQALVLRASRAMGGPNLALVMTLLVGTAALVTVIASVNVAGVLLSRAVVRQREFAVRVALGARKLRVFRQLGAEGLLLGLSGATAGLAVAEAGLRLIRSVDAEPIFQQIVLDWHEVAFVMLLGMIAPLLFSLAPALSALRVNPVAALNASSARSVGGGRRLRETLVVAQLALAVALAVVGGLVARTAKAQFSAPTGFEEDGLVAYTITLDDPDAASARRQIIRTIRDSLRDRGVTTSGVLTALPSVTIEPTTIVEPDGERDGSASDYWAHQIAIDEGTLGTLRLPLLAGQDLSATDIDRNAAVALVTRETARRYYGNVADAVGRYITIRTGDAATSYQIVGVTEDVRNTDPERGIPPRVWTPLSDPRTVMVAVRSAGDIPATTAVIREVMRGVVPDVPVEGLESYVRSIDRTQGGNRVAMGMLMSFAAIAVIFAAIGLYGTIALTANLRRAEFATRVALGAQTRDVTRLVLGQAFRLLAIGLVPGVVLGLLAGTGMRRLLFGVTPLDPLNILGVVAILTLITVCASAGPALRAARLDLIDVLRRS
jgi:putative ABC transport system permease protein